MSDIQRQGEAIVWPGTGITGVGWQQACTPSLTRCRLVDGDIAGDIGGSP